jgi:D-galactose 1-dehydrogenase
MNPIRLAIVGFGKIARDQHLPALAKTEGIELAAIANLDAVSDATVPQFTSLDALLAKGPPIDAVALCTPPQVRSAVAAIALRAGKHVLLEKPPGATISELGPLVAAAKTSGKTLFATWHSRFAAAVEPARAFLAKTLIRSVTVDWKEDVRISHPGQDWIFEPGGLGVFDPGINALSIMTRILPEPFFLTAATLAFPANRNAPVLAELDFADTTGVPIRAVFDFLQTGPFTWDIRVETGDGTLTLSAGGARMALDGRLIVDERDAEYTALYRHFVDLVGRGASDVDLAPFVHVADAFLLGRRTIVAPFEGWGRP